MSGDVQPRKRNKDKKRRRGNEKDHSAFKSFIFVLISLVYVCLCVEIPNIFQHFFPLLVDQSLSGCTGLNGI